MFKIKRKFLPLIPATNNLMACLHRMALMSIVVFNIVTPVTVGASPFHEPLHDAVEAGNVQEAERLIAQGADVNALENIGGLTPLHMAVSKGDKAMIVLLLSKGADVDAKDGRLGLLTPMKLAEFHANLAELLRQHREAPAHLLPDSATKLLIDATFDDNVFQVARLLKHSADLKVKDKYGNTPLHIAASLDHKELIPLLLKSGADPNLRNYEGYTPLHLMVRALIAAFLKSTSLNTIISDYREIIAMLLAKGADINARDNHGETPLHTAALFGSADVAILLIDNGADVTAFSILTSYI